MYKNKYPKGTEANVEKEIEEARKSKHLEGTEAKVEIEVEVVPLSFIGI